MQDEAHLVTPRLATCSTALPPYRYSQADLLEQLKAMWAAEHHNTARLEQLHGAVGVKHRHLALPKERYLAFKDFTERNQAFAEASLPLAEGVVVEALERTGLLASEVDYLVYTSITGLTVPSLDARLMNRLPFSPRVKRVPVFGWGCLGGAAGIARLSDLLEGKREGVGLLLSVELCSLTLQKQDFSVANLISSGLFGDGAAALVMTTRPGPGPRVVASRAMFFAESEHVMGWNIGAHGLSIVLSPEVPFYAEHHLVPGLQSFLADHGLQPADVAAWVAHPGGPKVIDVLENGLGLEVGALDITRRSLRDVGNLSSASVLFVLAEVLGQAHEPGDYGLILAMGPAFGAEAILIQW